MPIAWYICSMKQKPGGLFGRPMRYCAMDDHTATIRGDKGDWSETEVLGNQALVKVRASSTTLDKIAQETGFVRMPGTKLDDPLSSLDVAQRNVISSKLIDMGYAAAEISDRLGSDIRNKTLGQVLHFAAQRRLKPRWDDEQGQVVLDGISQDCRPVADVDKAVKE